MQHVRRHFSTEARAHLWNIHYISNRKEKRTKNQVQWNIYEYRKIHFTNNFIISNESLGENDVSSVAKAV